MHLGVIPVGGQVGSKVVNFGLKDVRPSLQAVHFDLQAIHSDIQTIKLFPNHLMALNDRIELVLRGLVDNSDMMGNYLAYALEIILIHESSSPPKLTYPHS
jgi:hypothetical protein